MMDLNKIKLNFAILYSYVMGHVNIYIFFLYFVDNIIPTCHFANTYMIVFADIFI